jgi:hypothetical protein
LLAFDILRSITMRIIPNQPRLRAIALGCWALGGWCIIYGGRVLAGYTATTLLVLSIELLALLGLSIGVAFWLLSSDRQAGIIFDGKGLLLNLGHLSAFISWANIKAVGVTARRDSLLSLGSPRQVGIALHDPQAYIQTYEERLPAARGLLARGMRLIDSALRPWRRASDAPIAAQLAACQAQTGYHLLVPEAMLGGTAEAFVQLVETYRLRPSARRTLEGLAWAG